MLKKLWSKPLTQWVFKTSYYLAILIGLLWLYGINGTGSNAPFIYNEF